MLTIVDDNSLTEALTLMGSNLYFNESAPGRAGRETSMSIAQFNKRALTIQHLNGDPNVYINRNITQPAFNILLAVYENNQSVYTEQLDGLGIMAELLRLESWFIQVVEPPPARGKLSVGEWKAELKEWLDREKTKLRGRTWYCHQDCDMIKVDKRIMSQVRCNLTALEAWYTGQVKR